jgi:hypothetical protein
MEGTMPIVVEVTVVTAGGTNSIRVSPDPVNVPAGVRGPIQWRITNPPPDGWRFHAKGVDISSPGDEFDDHGGGGSLVYTWHNKHNRPGRYKYVVRVQKGGATVELDPIIVNE